MLLFFLDFSPAWLVLTDYVFTPTLIAKQQSEVLSSTSANLTTRPTRCIPRSASLLALKATFFLRYAKSLLRYCPVSNALSNSRTFWYDLELLLPFWVSNFIDGRNVVCEVQNVNVKDILLRMCLRDTANVKSLLWPCLCLRLGLCSKYLTTNNSTT